MSVFIRGNVVEWTTSFFDAAGEPMTPDSATLTLKTATPGTPSEDVTIEMTQDGEEWTAEWDSTGFAGGTIFWAIKATNPHAADEGYFDLTGNMANA